MFAVDVPKLRGKIAERGFNLTGLAKEIGVDRNTLSKYLRTPEKMPIGILDALTKALCDTPEEVRSIFFCGKLT